MNDTGLAKFGSIAAVLFLIAATVSVCGKARADADGIQPSIPFSEQVAQECQAACLNVFKNKFGSFTPRPPTAAPPPAAEIPPPTEIYSKALTKLYFCQKKCE